jgi:hypothetical protein
MNGSYRARAVAAIIAVAGVGLITGCTAKSPVSLAAATPSSTGTAPSAAPSVAPTPAASGPRAPLTGLAISAISGVRTVVVPIAIVKGGHGPAGIGSADIVGVDYAEQGTIRLLAAFQSLASTEAGPVGSLRPSDARLFAQTGAAIVEGGTPSGFLDVVKAAGLSYVSSSGSGFSKRGDRSYADITSVRSHLSGGAAPAPMFEYATAGQPVSGVGVKAVTAVTVEVSGHASIVWKYDSKSKMWGSSVNGTSVTTANLVILTTPYTTKFVHALKRNATFAEPQGTGAAEVIAGPQAISASWYKNNLIASLNMLGPDKTVPQLSPGRTWIFLIPKGSSVRVS